MSLNFFIPTFMLSCLSLSLGEVVKFQEQVWPILEKRCVECHKAPYEKNGLIKNPKAGLRLDGAAYIMHGSDDGPVVVVDHPSRSSLYQRVILPEDDGDHMPPKGESLTKRQKETLRMWIAQGVDFGTWEGATDGLDELVNRKKATQLPQAFYLKEFDILAKGLKPVKNSILEDLSGSTRLLIRPIGIGSPLVEARVVTEYSEINDLTVKALLPVRRQLVKVDLRNSSITDDAIEFIAISPRLTNLNLMGTSVSSKGIHFLQNAPLLKSLNLVATRISDEDIDCLSSFPNLKKIYLWKSNFTSRGVTQLKKRNPHLEINY